MAKLADIDRRLSELEKERETLENDRKKEIGKELGVLADKLITLAIEKGFTNFHFPDTGRKMQVVVSRMRVKEPETKGKKK